MVGWRRLLVAAVLVGALVAMAVHYGAVADARDPYPTADELATDYGAHVGGPFYMWLRVVAVEEDTLLVRPHAGSSVTLRVVAADGGALSATASPGDVVQVYGTLDAGHRVAARRVVLSERADRRRMFAVSGLAAVLTAGAVLRRWTVDWSRLALVPRGGRDG